LDVLATPDTYHSAGIRRGTATSNFHAYRDNLSFADGWHIDSVEPSRIEITTNPEGALAWLLSATRISANSL
jgi:hypothetical protein